MVKIFNQRCGQYSLILIIVLLVVWLRWWRLPQVPPGFWYDEAYNAMDAAWMLDTYSPEVFFTGNHGREPMLHYLGALAMFVLGTTPYVFRLVSAFIGILTVPLLYRWVITLFFSESDRRWLGLIAAAGLTFSFWHIVMSRTGYRAVLFPFFVILTAYLFWQGWRSRSVWYFGAAGVALGLSQYTYLSARLLPLIFILFILLKIGFFKKLTSDGDWSNLDRSFWFGLAVMGGVSIIIFLPLALFFLSNPGALSSRTDQVFILDKIARGETTLLDQLWAALRVFGDGFDPNWRHNLVGQSGFNGLSLAGFWVGLVVMARNFRRPAYLFLLVSLFILWLTAPLSVPAVHTLRLSGLLPIFYVIMAVGLLKLANLTTRYLPWQSVALWIKPTLFVSLLLFSGVPSAYDYFVRWANEPEVYKKFEGPLTDLTHHLIAESRTADIILPLQMYIHPSVRFLLYNEFTEIETPPPLYPNRSAILVDIPDYSLLSDVNKMRESSGYVRLTRYPSGQGFAVVSSLANLKSVDMEKTAPFTNPYTNEPVALLTTLPNAESVLAAWQTPPIDTYRWPEVVQLVGYEFFPSPAQPGQVLLLNLYWQTIGTEFLNYKTFVRIVNGQGVSIGEWDQSPVSELMLHWHEHGIILTPFKLYLSPETKPGPYVVQVGLVDLSTGRPLSPQLENEAFSGQIPLDLFYVVAHNVDFDQPQNPLQLRLGNQIELVGYSSPQLIIAEPLSLRFDLYWRATERPSWNYLTFAELLNAEGQPVASLELSPLTGQYPVSYWSPGKIVVDELNLSLPDNLPPGEYRLVVGMYDPFTKLRLPIFDANDQRLPEDRVTLSKSTLSQ